MPKILRLPAYLHTEHLCIIYALFFYHSLSFLIPGRILVGTSSKGICRDGAGPYYRKYLSVYISVMLLHYICSKIHLCFLATLENIAPEYFLPHSLSFYF